MAANHADCVSFNRHSKTIDDPAMFCKSSYLRVDTGSNPPCAATLAPCQTLLFLEGEGEGGTESSFEMKSFGKGEQLDCTRIAVKNCQGHG